MGPPGVTALIHAASDTNQWVRLAGLYGLGLLPERDALVSRTLLAAFNDPTPGVHAMAVRSLGNIGSLCEEEIVALLDALTDLESLWIRRDAARALKSFAGKAYLGEAITRIASEGPMRARLGAAEVLLRARTHIRPAMRTCLEGLGMPDASVRRSAARILRSQGASVAEALPVLFDKLDDTDARVRGVIVQAVGKVGANDSRTLSKLIGALEDSSSDVRIRAALCLGDYGPKAAAAIPKLEECRSKSDDLAEYVAITLVIAWIDSKRLPSPDSVWLDAKHDAASASLAARKIHMHASDKLPREEPRPFTAFKRFDELLAEHNREREWGGQDMGRGSMVVDGGLAIWHESDTSVQDLADALKF
jgi:HEAT repeat protein